MSEEGFELEARIHYLLCGIITILREGEIKKKFEDNSLNGIDHLVHQGNVLIAVQDKWKISVGQQEMSQFLDCVSRVIKHVPEVKIVHTILVTRTKPTANAIKTLEDKHTVILQCDDMKMLSMMCCFKILEILQIDAARLIIKSPYCGKLRIIENIEKMERIKQKTPPKYLHIFKKYINMGDLFDENEFNFEIYKTEFIR